MIKNSRKIGVFCLVSGIAMPFLWLVLWMLHKITKDKALFIPESITVAMLLAAGIALLA